MKIGIYGDSFACPKSSTDRKINTDTPWMTLIEKSNNHDITNFALSGTSMYWSYNIYKENHTKFDKNIFVATSPGRLYIPWNDDRQHWTNSNIINKTYTKLNKNLSLFDEIYDYYLKIYNPNEHKLYKELMLKDIAINNNTLVIDTENVPYKISQKEYKYYSHEYKLIDKIDNRWCHMSQEGNNFLAERIQVWLETNNFNIDDWQENCSLPPMKKGSSYFIKFI